MIRTATAEDLGQVDALMAQSFPRLLAADYPPSVRVLAVPMIARANPALLRSGRYYVAVSQEGRIVAAGGWSPQGPVGRFPEGERRGQVRHMATDPRHLRRGAGRAILGRVFAAASEEGLVRLDCLATRTAVPFYGALGFEMVGPVEVPLAPGIAFPALHMRRAL